MKKNQTSILTSTNIVISAVDKAVSKAQAGIKTAASPLKTNNTGAKQSASVLPPTGSAAYSAGRNVVDVQLASKVLNDARLLNEKQQHEAQVVRQLPNDFPVENWEKMPVKAQLFAIQHSGLSKEDQWTVLNASAPLKVLAAANVSTSTGTRSGNGSGNQQVPFSGQDAETQRAEQRASRKATDAYNQLNQALASKNVDTNSLSSAGNDIYRSTRIAMAYEVLQGTLDSSKQSKMINDAKAGIAPGKTSPTTVQDWNARVTKADTASKELMDTLESVHVDTDNLTTPQSYIIEKAERMLRDGIISGTLTEAGTNEMIRRICNQVTSETTPPKGVTYVTLMDPKLNLKSATTKKEELMIRRETAFNQAGQLLEDALKGINVDTGKLSDQQERIVLAEQQNLADGMLDGSIKGNAISAFVENVCYRIATETTPPPGVTYVTIMDPGYKQRKDYEEEKRKEDKKKSDIEFKVKVNAAITEMDSLLSREIDFDTSKLTEAQKTLYNNAIRDIQNKLMNGPLIKEYKDQMFYTLANKLSSKVYEYEYTNTHGKKVIGTVTTDELIDPEDNSTGARLARYALNLYGLGYEKKAVLNPGDPIFKQVEKVIDCSGLVNYSAFRISPDLAKEIGNGARYQIANTKDGEIWRKTTEDTVPEIEDLETGDLLYWADENNKIVHTAIYLRDGLMVESGNGGVKISEIRFTTVDNDGSKHNLVQVNRLD